MFIVLSQNNPDPMYKQVTDQVKDAIASGDLKPNEKLPSIRELAEALSISAITVKRAYFDLESEGYIVTRAGLRSFVAEIDLGDLRKGKLAEFRKELEKILATGNKFGVTADEIVHLIRRIQEDRHESHS